MEAVGVDLTAIHETEGGRNPCLARAVHCVPPQGCCQFVGVLPTGCLHVAFLVTEKVPVVL